jgi:hypothetical protein
MINSETITSSVSGANSVTNSVPQTVEGLFRGTDQSKYKIPENAPVLPTLASQMGVELMITDNGFASILFNKPLPASVHWIDYDMDAEMITFVTWDGKIFGLGIRIFPAFAQVLKDMKNIHLIYIPSKDKIYYIDTPILIVRSYGV